MSEESNKPETCPFLIYVKHHKKGKHYCMVSGRSLDSTYLCRQLWHTKECGWYSVGYLRATLYPEVCPFYHYCCTLPESLKKKLPGKPPCDISLELVSKTAYRAFENRLGEHYRYVACRFFSLWFWETRKGDNEGCVGVRDEERGEI